MAPEGNNGIIDKPNKHTVDVTLEKLRSALQENRVTIFTVADNSGEAEEVGIPMRPTKLIIFGNPKAGTPLMLDSPGVAINLPLNVLVWEDNERKA